ncbi:MAG: hypothetical protein KI791_02750 [Cyclobacteriaceae bacterium]|nr:hypothetical protein [Cyclobacteriaceae bacterium SS2]
MNSNSLLNYYKTILEKVSFDDFLVKKEYKKALQSVDPSERPKLERWVNENRLIRN